MSTYEKWREQMEARGHLGYMLSREWFELTDGHPFTDEENDER